MAAATESDSLLWHGSLNHGSRSETVLLIHGAFTTSNDWDLVTPFLQDNYHLLVPDLPAHGHSQHMKPFSVARAAQLLRDLIIKKAHNGIAHVVGHSLGAHVAIRLASQYPEVVSSRVLVSGFEVFPTTPNTWLSSAVPYAAWASQRIEKCIPRPVVRWLMDGTDIQRADSSFCTMELCRQICSPMTDDSESWPSPWPHATLVVAAGKAGILPTSDRPQDAIRLAKIGQQMNDGTIAVVQPQMRHPWNRQAPELFATTVRAWLDGGQLPDGFHRLDLTASRKDQHAL